jgi:hypothetical protein
MMTTPVALTSIPSLADLRTVPSASGSTYQAIIVLGYAVPNDGGDGLFVWNASSTSADNDGTIITPSDSMGAGRWVRDFAGPVNVRWFGASGNVAVNQYNALMAAYVFARDNGHNLHFPKGSYRFDTALDLTYTTFFPAFLGETPGTPGDPTRRGSWLGFGGAAGTNYAIRITDSGTTIAPTFRNLAFTPGNAERAFLNNNNSFLSFENCNFEAAINSATSCLVELRNSTLSENNCEHNSFLNCRFQEYRGAAIRLTNQLGTVNASHNFLTIQDCHFSPQNSAADDIDVGGLNVGGTDGGAAISRSSIEGKTFVSPSGSFIHLREGCPIIDTFFAVEGEAASAPHGTRILVDDSSTPYINWWGGINIVSAGDPQYPIMADSLAGVAPSWTEFPGTGWPSANIVARQSRLSGQPIRPQTPAVLAYNGTGASGVTGDGTAYTLSGLSIAYDDASSFNGASGTFTASVNGRYRVIFQCALGGLSSSNTSGFVSIIVSTGQEYRGEQSNLANIRDVSGNTILMAQAVPYLAAGQTLTFRVRVDGSATKNVNILSVGSSPMLTSVQVTLDT